MNNEFIKVSAEVYYAQYNTLVKGLPEELRLLIEKYNVIIAGGALTSIFAGTEIKDYDLYPPNKCVYNEFIKELVDKIKTHTNRTDYKIICSSPNAVTYKFAGKVVQVIKKYCDIGSLVYTANLTVEEVVETFDFTTCMCALDLNSKIFVMHKNFIQDTCRRSLIFNSNTVYPICSLYRVTKYIRKGFTISGGELIKLALSINNLEMNSYQDLKEQLLGIDTYEFIEITDALIERKGKNAPIDFSEVMELVNRKLTDLWEPEQR